MLRASLAGIGVVGAMLVAGCTVSNPAYEPGDDAAINPEVGSGLELGAQGDGRRGDGSRNDTTSAPDTRRAFDIKPAPDTAPWQCKNSGDCNDALDCTLDTCNSQKRCENTLKSGCLIFASCFGAGDQNPLNPCEVCTPATSTSAWSTAADGASCTSDGLGCTADVCRSGACKHELAADACLIANVCYAGGATNPKDTCQTCSPTDLKDDWSPKKEGAFCASDGLSCTVDSCKAGICTHEVNSKACLVGGQCFADGQSPWNDPCHECNSASSSTALSFITGKACDAGSQPGVLAGMCYKNKCAPWVETVFDPKVPGPNPVQSSAFNAVDHIPSSGQVWAAGEYTTQYIEGGVLIPLGGSIIPALPVITANRFRGLKHRLAVGDAGIAMVHEGVTGWAHQAKIEAYLAGLYRVGVWGAPLANGTETFFLTGNQTASQTGIVSCTIGIDTTCTDHTGVENNLQLGPVFGALSPTGGLAGIWALRLSTVTDVYYNPGTGTAWSLASPEGCEDLGNSTGSPCSQTTGSWRDLFANGPSDVWAVGGSGLLMHWDGLAWARHSSVLPSQSSYTMTAVFASPSDGLVTVAATSTAFNGRWVYLFNYNQSLSRWLGPIVLLSPTSNNNGDEVRDLGGQGYGALWAVGVRQVASSSGTPRNQAWAVQLKP